MTIRCPFCALGIPRVQSMRGPMKGQYYHPLRPLTHPAMVKARALGVQLRKRTVACLAGEATGSVVAGVFYPPYQPFAALLARIDGDTLEEDA